MSILYPKDVEALVAEAPEVLPQALREAERRGWEGTHIFMQIVRDMVSEAKEAKKATPVVEPAKVEPELPVATTDLTFEPEPEPEPEPTPAAPSRHRTGRRSGK